MRNEMKKVWKSKNNKKSIKKFLYHKRFKEE